MMVPLRRSADEIAGWLATEIARELGRSPAEIDRNRPFLRFGLDSVTVVGLSGDLEVWLGRELSPMLLKEYPTIQLLSMHLAGNSEPEAHRSSEPSVPLPFVSGLRAEEDHAEWTRTQRAVRRLIRALMRICYRCDIAGMEHCPPRGALIVAANHLHLFDAALIFGALPRRVVFLVSDHMRSVPLVNWFLRNAGGAVYVSRGEADVSAMADALAVLRAGGALVIAPEGRISKSGGLLPGRGGAIHLASESGAPILPLVGCGHESPFRRWLTLRKVPLHMRAGPLERISGECSGESMDGQRIENPTDALMIALARLLPAEYRGVYRDRAAPRDPV